MVLAMMNKPPGMGVKAAPAVTKPDGTKVIKRSKMIAQKTRLIEELWMYLQNGRFNHFGLTFENPYRYR